MNEIVNVSRRQFLKTAVVGGGLVLAFSLPLSRSRVYAAGPGDAPFTGRSFYDPDDRLTVIFG